MPIPPLTSDKVRYVTHGISAGRQEVHSVCLQRQRAPRVRGREFITARVTALRLQCMLDPPRIV
jgi:hypothetical protein